MQSWTNNIRYLKNFVLNILLNPPIIVWQTFVKKTEYLKVYYYYISFPSLHDFVAFLLGVVSIV